MGQARRASQGQWQKTAIGARWEMSLYKRGGIYWYKFMWQGKLIRESTKQGNDKIARNMESAHRTSLAKGEVGIRDKKPTVILSEFIENRFEPWVKSTFEKT